MSSPSVVERGCAHLSRAVSGASLAAVFAVILVAITLVPVDQARAKPMPPSISLTKTPSTTTYSAAGQVITYTYVVTNNAPFAYYISISDDRIGDFKCPGMLGGMGTLTCTGSYTITAGDVSAGSVTNTAIAYGTPTCEGSLGDDPS